MNTFMWDHPHTAKHLKKIQRLGIHIIDPVAKKLACGDVGMKREGKRGEEVGHGILFPFWVIKFWKLIYQFWSELL